MPAENTRTSARTLPRPSPTRRSRRPPLPSGLRKPITPDSRADSDPPHPTGRAAQLTRWRSGAPLAALAQAPPQPGLDERLQLAVQHRLDVADLHAGPNVLDERVGLQHVVPDLVAEVGRHHLAAQLIAPPGGLLLLVLEQPRAQHLHRDLAVLDLRAFVLALDHDPGGQVCDPHGGVGLVDVL